ncbi:methionine/alanine import family NSS transporter small subunit [Cytobacillus sp. Hm23]
MDGSAIVMMVLGILIIWGGLAASVTNAILKAKKK